jgi:hypothetical protein
MKKVEEQLPNGFHDGVLRRMDVDHSSGTLRLDIDFWIGALGTEQSETYRVGCVTVSGLAMVAIDPPGGEWPPGVELTIDGSSGQPDGSPGGLPRLPDGAFVYWLFVNEWNAYIRIAGMGASLEWLGEPIDRGW